MKRQRDIKIDGKTSGSFLKKLDLDINTWKERMKLIEELTQDDYWLNVNDYVKINISQNDELNSNNLVAKNLERMANYFLYAPDSEPITKKTQYNIYKDEKAFLKACKERESKKEDDSLDFLLNQNYNYYLSTDLKLTKKDYEKKYISDYYNYSKHMKLIIDYGIQDIKNKIHKINGSMDLSYDEKINKINELLEKNEKFKEYKENIIERIENSIKNIKNNKNIDKKEKKYIINKLNYLKRNLYKYLVRWIGDNTHDSIDIKRNLDGVITFKHIINYYHESADRINLIDEIDMFNPKHVKELLKVNKDNVKDETLLCILINLYQYIDECEFDSFKLQIIQLLRQDKTLIEISKILGTSYQNIQRHIDTMIDKIIKKHEINYEENYYYLELVKGKYKTCKKCGQVKLIQRFDKDLNGKDGYRNICKSCRNNKNILL